MADKEYFVQGNEACALGALAAGCRFFAGYPITPSTEIAEIMSKKLPTVGGHFVQMEDEISAIGAIIGASWGGTKSCYSNKWSGYISHARKYWICYNDRNTNSNN